MFSTFVKLSLLLLFASPAAAGVVDFGVSKSLRFVQKDGNPPVTEAEDGYLFVAFFSIDAPGRVASGTVSLPNGTSHELIREGITDVSFFHAMLFGTASELHQAYPFGVYTFSLTVDDVVYSATLDLVEVPFPSAPYIVNYVELQDVDASQAFSVEWAAIAGATSDDYIILDVEEYRSPEPWEPGALTGADSSVLVPEGVLSQGVTESVLTYLRVGDRNTVDIPEVTGIAAVATFTEFEISAKVGSLGGFEILTDSLPAAQLGQFYSTPLSANESVLLWLADDEELLPDGIQLDAFTGQLTGVPTEAGTFVFTMSAISLVSNELATRKLTLTVLGGVPAPVEIGGASFENGVFTFTIPSPDGQSVQIDISSNLRDWFPLAVAEPVNGIIQFDDSESATLPKRFYRASWK